MMQSISDLVMNINDGARAAHAFACEGRDGEARRAFVRDLAAGLLCTSNGVRPCGHCPSCLQVAAGTSMDVVHMNKSTGSSKSGRETYKADDAAAFIERLSMGAYGRYLIGVIDDADTLSETVQNKLLKTLEEPAPQTLIILGVSNRDNLLSTVRSRISFVRLNGFEGYSSAAEGEAADSEEETGGLPAAAEPIVPMFTDRTAAFHEIRSALEKNIRSREDALALLDSVEDVFRDRMISSASGKAAYNTAQLAHSIERIGTARMDIRRDMQHHRALKRLYLEL